MPNGAKLHRTEVTNKRGDKMYLPLEAMKLKREGLEVGAPDILIFNRPSSHITSIDLDGKRIRILNIGVALEMKKKSGGVHGDDQKRWQAALEDLGWVYVLAFGAQDAINKLSKLGY